MHTFTTHLEWTGAGRGPTADPAAFSRDLDVTAGTTTIPMSSAPQFRGDPARVNPEQLFVAAISACHALTYLFLAARAGIAIRGYADDPEGTLAPVEGRLQMTRVVLHPRIALVRAADEPAASKLIAQAHRGCIIGNSVASQVEVAPVFITADQQAA